MSPVTEYYREAIAAAGRRLVAAVLGFELALALVEAVGLGLLAPLAQIVLDGSRSIGPLGRITPAAAVVIGGVLILIRVALQWATTTYSSALRLRTSEHLRLSTIGAVLAADWSYIVGQRRSAVVQALTTQADRAESAVSALIQSTTVGLVAAATLIAGIVVQPVLGSLVIVVLLVGGLFSRVAVRRAQRMGEEWSALSTAFGNIASDALGSLRIARAHGAERAWLEAVQESTAASRTVFLRYVRTAANSRAVLTLASFAIAGAMVAIGKSLDVAGPTLVGLAVIALRGISSAQSFVQSISHFFTYAPAIEHLRTIRHEAAAHPHSDEPRAISAEAELQLEGVGMEIGGHALLNALTLTVGRAGMVALTGRSGAGKTTALDICVGLLRASTGSVAMREGDGDWRAHLAYVPQHPLLLPASVRENLSWSAGRQVTDEEIWAVLIELDIAIAVQRLPGGLDAQLGDSGTLSGGEQQRLCLARALLRRPTLLILDEPTAGLDARSEAAIIAALQSFPGGVLVATHSAAIVDAADQVVKLDRD